MVLLTQRRGSCLLCTLLSNELRLVSLTARNVNRQFSSRNVQSGKLQDVLGPTNKRQPNSGNEKLDLEPKAKAKRAKIKSTLDNNPILCYPPPANNPRKTEATINGTKRRHALARSGSNREFPPVPGNIRSPGKGARSLGLERPSPPETRPVPIRSPGKGSHSLILGRSSLVSRLLPTRSTSHGSVYRLFDNTPGRGGKTPLAIIYRRAMAQFEDLRSDLLLAFHPPNHVGSRANGFVGITTEEEFNSVADDFAASLGRSFEAANGKNELTIEKSRPDQVTSIGSNLKLTGSNKSDEASVFHELQQAHNEDPNNLFMSLKYLFTKYACNAKADPQIQHQQAKIVDLRYPIEWFPATRAMQRKIHLHIGPTNSGKTYHALQRLEQAKSGIYAGPLRLLAHEIYSRLNAKGKPCSLITGDERRVPEGPAPTMSSCTVEMVPLNSEVDVAVIDEIQMLGDEYRGWAWTQALLGVKAREVHLCGEVRTISVIKDLCKLMGDELTIHQYERLTPLECMGKSLNGKLNKLKKGDCIILFSRVAIHAMKKEVEKATGKRCAVVYGSLPPETRAQQAALFNDPDNDYDFLVASDAVGMGLNLAIRRVIFESLSKFNGRTHVDIPTSEIKQISGRAGRYKTAAEAVNSTGDQANESSLSLPIERNVGLATTLYSVDHALLKRAMSTDVEPIRTVGIFPPSTIIQKFAAQFPRGTPLSYVLMRLKDIATTNPLFALCDFNEQLLLSDLIEPLGLTLQDQLIFIASPANVKRREQKPIIEAMAAIIANHSSVDLLDIPELDFELLHESPKQDKAYLANLEALHQGLTLYLWLSYRFAGVFKRQALAFHIKSLVEEKIDDSLANVTFEENRRKKIESFRLKALKQQAANAQVLEHTPLSYEDEDRQEPLLDEFEKGEDEDEEETVEEPGYEDEYSDEHPTEPWPNKSNENN